jgi:hypothetical protein
LYTRQQEGAWLLTTAGKPEETLELRSIGSQIRMADLYEDVDLQP